MFFIAYPAVHATGIMSTAFEGSGNIPYSNSKSKAPMSSTRPVGPESQTGMDASAGTSQVDLQQTQKPRPLNMSILCHIGQETIHEIVAKATEVFQTLKLFHSAAGTVESSEKLESKKSKLDDILNNIAILFNNLRNIHEICIADSEGVVYSDIESLVPFKDEMDPRRESRKTVHEMSEEYISDYQRELAEQLLLKNRQLKEVIDHLRLFIWEINTMLATGNSIESGEIPFASSNEKKN